LDEKDIEKMTKNSNANKSLGFWGKVGSNPEKLGFWMTLPTMLLLAFIVVFPLIMQLYLSVTMWSPLDGVPWYKAYESFDYLGQYWRLLQDAEMWGAIGRTLFIMLITIPIQFALGLGLATLFVDEFPGKKFFYSVLLTPMMIVPAVAGLIFYLCFQGTGPINNHLGLPTNFSWLTDRNRAIITIIVSEIWQWTPLMFLILLAGMLGVPNDQILAARLLGASEFQIFKRIVIPRMKRVIIIVLALRTVESFKVFDSISVMTKGGPGVQTETISVYLYRMTFGDYEWGYVAAIGLSTLLALSVLAAQLLKRGVQPAIISK
jgi:multiple sugar transport system permease protein